jgi:CHAD domain-containing protein
VTAEVERAFDLAPGQELPTLPGLGEFREFALEATYYDTRHFALTRARHVLRRRVGGADEGWHVKLPGADVEHRIEHHAPLGAPRPPAELRVLIEGPLAGQALLPVARLHTVRREAELRGPGGELWALVCVDDVVATSPVARQAWREAEVELAGGPAALIEDLTARLAAVGIRPALMQAKIGRTLGAAIEADDRRSTGPLSAADAVLDYLSVHLGTLQALEAGVLADQPDAVHRSRVATRRMRSALAVFEPLFDRVAVRELRAELAWHAVELGAPRDAEVLRDHALSALDSIGVAESAPQRGEIAARLNGAHRAAHAELAETMATQRYDGLHELLAGWLADPGLTAAAGAPAVPLLHGLLDRARGRAAERYGRALADPWNMTGWHEARKAAKAVRYGAEAVVAAFGDRAGAHAAAWEAVTDALGEVQDSVVARDALTDRAGDPVVDALLAFQVGRGQAELARGRAALESALAASL